MLSQVEKLFEDTVHETNLERNHLEKEYEKCVSEVESLINNKQDYVSYLKNNNELTLRKKNDALKMHENIKKILDEEINLSDSINIEEVKLKEEKEKINLKLKNLKNNSNNNESFILYRNCVMGFKYLTYANFDYYKNSVAGYIVNKKTGHYKCFKYKRQQNTSENLWKNLDDVAGEDWFDKLRNL